MKKGLSDFIKLAYKYNKVKDLSEAFKDNPVSDEWHKGRIENILKDNEFLYNNIYKIDNDQILFKIGKLDNKRIEEY